MGPPTPSRHRSLREPRRAFKAEGGGESPVFDRIAGRIVHVLLATAALLTFCLSFLVVADVAGRVLFNSPVKGTPEIVSMSIVIICFLLAGYSVHSRAMLQTDVLIGLMGRRGPSIASLMSAVLGCVFFGLIVWGSYEPTLHAWTSGEFEGEGALRVPVWPARLVVMLGALLVTLTYFGQAIASAVALVRGVPEFDLPPQQPAA
jgi:TRAP-type C4-dicarboxylate transport system permease small subunit